MTAQALDQARALLKASRGIAVLTGAGMSAESGVPTFRDAQTGLWSQFDPMQLASEEGFRADPALVWRWYAWRRKLVAEAKPNAGHLALAAVKGRLTLITQNVDGLHARAGSTSVLELHGNILRTKCLANCGARFDAPDDLPHGEPPRCPACGDWLRPDVVWFGELLDPRVLAAAEAAADECDVMLVVGTSGLVYPAAGLPARAARRDARIVIINPNESDLDDQADLVIRSTAAQALPVLLD